MLKLQKSHRTKEVDWKHSQTVVANLTVCPGEYQDTWEVEDAQGQYVVNFKGQCPDYASCLRWSICGTCRQLICCTCQEFNKREDCIHTHAVMAGNPQLQLPRMDREEDYHKWVALGEIERSEGMQMLAETDTPVQSDVEDTEVVWSDGSGGSYLKRLNSSIAAPQEKNDHASFQTLWELAEKLAKPPRPSKKEIDAQQYFPRSKKVKRATAGSPQPGPSSAKD